MKESSRTEKGNLPAIHDQDERKYVSSSGPHVKGKRCLV